MSIPPGVMGYDRLIEKALDLKAKDIWAVFCLSDTAWEDNDNPPSVTPSDNAVEEPYLIVRVTEKFLVRSISLEDYELLDPMDRVSIGGLYFASVADVDAYTEYARWLYLKWTIDTTVSHPAGTFRQIKLFTGLTTSAGYENYSWLTPEHVDAYGSFLWGRNYPLRTVLPGDIWSARRIIEER